MDQPGVFNKKIWKIFSHTKTEISNFFIFSIYISWTDLVQSIKKIQKICYSHTKTKIFKKAFIHLSRKNLL